MCRLDVETHVQFNVHINEKAYSKREGSGMEVLSDTLVTDRWEVPGVSAIHSFLKAPLKTAPSSENNLLQTVFDLKLDS